jgi:2-hydroxychromene-2-carboxylate isomerase
MIDFWVSIGSTYSYLAVMRLKRVERETRVAFRWRPFSVRAIMIEQKNIPFVGKPVKFAYMWRDIERRAQTRGLEPRLPAPYPLKEFDLANRVAIVGEDEGWCADYVHAAYRCWFHRGHEPGLEPGLSDVLREIGQDSSRVVELAQSETTAERYRQATEEAKALGVFGSPTFVVDGEVFWGDDRLEDALQWHERGGARVQIGA